jgi:cell division septation protein DedD
VITVLVSGAIWYFGFYRPQQQAEEKARQEQLAKQAAAEAAAAKKKAEAERLAAEQAANEAADADEAASKEASFSTISEPTGRYYVVIASFIDADMANDLGEKLKADGVSSALLTPKGSKKFNRLTLGDFGSFNEAQEEANKLKAEFGDGLWVLKF